MRYVVTGGAGFIGSNTVDELVRRGHSVVVLDDLSAGKEENLTEVRNKITFIKGSITDIETVRRAMHEADYVLHLAARTSVPRSVKDFLFVTSKDSNALPFLTNFEFFLFFLHAILMF